jgi:hypothetical protein
MQTHSARMLAIFACSFFAEPAAAQEGRDMRLEDAGFIMRPANTPQALARLRQLPPRTMVARTKDGQRTYFYADPDYCKCVFVGNQQALQAFRDMPARTPQPDVVPPTGIDPERFLIREMNEDVATDTGDQDDILNSNTGFP